MTPGNEYDQQHLTPRTADDPTSSTERDQAFQRRDISEPASEHRLEHETRTLELREEELLAKREVVPAGTVRVRRQVDTVPAHLEVEAFRDEVEIDREPIGREVSERVDPWEEDGVRVFPIYEEQLVVVKRLVLKEHVRVRPVRRHETRLLEDTVMRERLVVEDPENTGLVHEVYPTDKAASDEKAESPGLFERAVRKVIE